MAQCKVPLDPTRRRGCATGKQPYANLAGAKHRGNEFEPCCKDTSEDEVAAQARWFRRQYNFTKKAALLFDEIDEAMGAIGIYIERHEEAVTEMLARNHVEHGKLLSALSDAQNLVKAELTECLGINTVGDVPFVQTEMAVSGCSSFEHLIIVASREFHPRLDAYVAFIEQAAPSAPGVLSETQRAKAVERIRDAKRPFLYKALKKFKASMVAIGKFVHKTARKLYDRLGPMGLVLAIGVAMASLPTLAVATSAGYTIAFANTTAQMLAGTYMLCDVMDMLPMVFGVMQVAKSYAQGGKHAKMIDAAFGASGQAFGSAASMIENLDSATDGVALMGGAALTPAGKAVMAAKSVVKIVKGGVAVGKIGYKAGKDVAVAGHAVGQAAVVEIDDKLHGTFGVPAGAVEAGVSAFSYMVGMMMTKNLVMSNSRLICKAYNGAFWGGAAVLGSLYNTGALILWPIADGVSYVLEESSNAALPGLDAVSAEDPSGRNWFLWGRQLFWSQADIDRHVRQSKPITKSINEYFRKLFKGAGDTVDDYARAILNNELQIQKLFAKHMHVIIPVLMALTAIIGIMKAFELWHYSDDVNDRELEGMFRRAKGSLSDTLQRFGRMTPVAPVEDVYDRCRAVHGGNPSDCYEAALKSQKTACDYPSDDGGTSSFCTPHVQGLAASRKKRLDKVHAADVAREEDRQRAEKKKRRHSAAKGKNAQRRTSGSPSVRKSGSQSVRTSGSPKFPKHRRGSSSRRDQDATFQAKRRGSGTSPSNQSKRKKKESKKHKRVIMSTGSPWNATQTSALLLSKKRN